MSNPKKPPPRHEPLDRGVQTHLGDQLRRYYQSILAEPVPDRLSSLLDELERAERAALAAESHEDDRR